MGKSQKIIKLIQKFKKENITIKEIKSLELEYMNISSIYTELSRQSEYEPYQMVVSNAHINSSFLKLYNNIAIHKDNINYKSEIIIFEGCVFDEASSKNIKSIYSKLFNKIIIRDCIFLSNCIIKDIQTEELIISNCAFDGSVRIEDFKTRTLKLENNIISKNLKIFNSQVLNEMNLTKNIIKTYNPCAIFEKSVCNVLIEKNEYCNKITICNFEDDSRLNVNIARMEINILNIVNCNLLMEKEVKINKNFSITQFEHFKCNRVYNYGDFTLNDISDNFLQIQFDSFYNIGSLELLFAKNYEVDQKFLFEFFSHFSIINKGTIMSNCLGDIVNSFAKMIRKYNRKELTGRLISNTGAIISLLENTSTSIINYEESDELFCSIKYLKYRYIQTQKKNKFERFFKFIEYHFLNMSKFGTCLHKLLYMSLIIVLIFSILFFMMWSIKDKEFIFSNYFKCIGESFLSFLAMSPVEVEFNISLYLFLIVPEALIGTVFIAHIINLLYRGIRKATAS